MTDDRINDSSDVERLPSAAMDAGAAGLLELLTATHGELSWIGPIPYDALAARYHVDHPDAA